MTECMGGWCERRNSCPHHGQAAYTELAERLCGEMDGAKAGWPVVVYERTDISPRTGLPAEQQEPINT